MKKSTLPSGALKAFLSPERLTTKELLVVLHHRIRFMEVSLALLGLGLIAVLVLLLTNSQGVRSDLRPTPKADSLNAGPKPSGTAIVNGKQLW